MSIATKRVAVTTAAIQLHAATAWNTRRSRMIFNNGPITIWVGGDNTVTTGTGFPVPPGAVLTLDRDAVNDVWAICSVLQVSPADTCVLAESQS